jgi:hypothetical protein
VFARALGIDPVFVHATKRRGVLIAPWKYGYQAREWETARARLLTALDA